MITTQQKQLVTATVPVLKENGVLLTTHFYRRLFTYNPELKNVFNMGNQQNGRQQTALAMAVLAYAEHIEDPSVLFPVVDRIGHKHTSLVIRPEHYAIVGHHLLESIREVLGEAATEPLIEAWGVAYNQLAKLMSGHEADLYSIQAALPGGWNGWREFVIKDKIEESTEITSFHLYPADGGKISAHQPGQYLSVRLFLPELDLMQPRQYSISNSPNNLYYRISVKRETGREPNPDGMISNRLHNFIKTGDIIEVTAPAGSFVLQNPDKPVVFISGGVGQTPLISMMESLLKNKSDQSLIWIHGCRNQDVHAFKGVIEYWATNHEKLKSHTFYNTIPVENQTENTYKGIVNLKQLKEEIITEGAAYYICGPAGFIDKQFNELKTLGVDSSAIYFEEFGPQALVLN